MSLVFAKKLVGMLHRTHLIGLLLHGIALGYFFYFKIRNNFKILNSRYLPPKNRPRFILAGNHASGADAYLLLAGMTGRYLRRIHAVAHEKSFRADTFEKLLLTAYDMIPRVGSGKEIVHKMGEYLYNNKTIAIVPEGMYSKRVMQGYTGVMRLYWLVNRQYDQPQIPIIPVATIGATEAYPFEKAADGKYHMKKSGIIARIGPPILLSVPKIPPSNWFRDQTDALMQMISKLGRQGGDIIKSWKLESMKRDKTREYRI